MVSTTLHHSLGKTSPRYYSIVIYWIGLPRHVPYLIDPHEGINILFNDHSNTILVLVRLFKHDHFDIIFYSKVVEPRTL
jgi:hypothetical protein